eukprot:8986680-Pyramimonas_sp.AAC.2
MVRRGNIPRCPASGVLSESLPLLAQEDPEQRMTQQLAKSNDRLHAENMVLVSRLGHLAGAFREMKERG